LDDVAKELQQQTRESFKAWLRDGDRVFHICGKAGSGKSTLMKFLHNHGQVKSQLMEWAGAKTLVLSQFFFWRSGDETQMSLDGLDRSLLVETLKQCPELIPDVFPDQWKCIRGEQETSLAAEVELFRPRKVEKAFQCLVSRPGHSRHRFCFFIDGLDEYSGDSVEHWDLAKSLKM
jgi:ATPase subunit of ABC transporter with duplicated ATPase domains